jgi:hypothetical protein
MKKLICTFLTLFAAQGAHAEIYQGLYVPIGANCGALSDNYFQIGDGWVGRHETYCQITGATGVERMDAFLLDTTCSAEGEDMGAQRFFIASTSTMEGPGLTVYSAYEGYGAGNGSIYKFCPGVQ